jgi:CRISPR-associated protein Cas1
LVIEHGEVSLTSPLITKAAQLGVSIIWCDDKHMPCAYTQPMVGHTLQSLRHRQQLEAGKPLYKQIWARLVKSKLSNQARVIEHTGQEAEYLHRMAKEVRSGDPDNKEGQGARWYWPRLFEAVIEPSTDEPYFVRDRDGMFPNNLLNYGYAIVRAAMARALIGAGLCLTVGVHHHNQYNAFCLADDCMEPYRPWVDFAVWQLVQSTDGLSLNKETKQALLSLTVADTFSEGKQRPMLVSMEAFANSLGLVFAKEKEVHALALPEFA